MPEPRPASALGRRGETLAREHLEGMGYRFVTRNWFCPAGELDLVMRDGDELVFVEVKTRWGEDAGRADDSVTRAKARKLLAACQVYLSKHPGDADRIWRCDLVAITFASGREPYVAHYANAVVAG